MRSINLLTYLLTGCGRCDGSVALRDMVELLLRRGADPNVSSVPQPPLLLAVQHADVELVRALLIAGADPQITLPQSVQYSLHHHHRHHRQVGS